jgi:hypothetical protein
MFFIKKVNAARLPWPHVHREARCGWPAPGPDLSIFDEQAANNRRLRLALSMLIMIIPREPPKPDRKTFPLHALCSHSEGENPSDLTYAC